VKNIVNYISNGINNAVSQEELAGALGMRISELVEEV